jgi:hypothetical protein|tara:strand:+ start:545 stop:748 length:204 start_codon:yes stop_codon:yes gene_type:complete
MAQLPESVLDDINMKMVVFSGVEASKIGKGSSALSDKKIKKLFSKTSAEHERLLKKAFRELGGKDGR